MQADLGYNNTHPTPVCNRASMWSEAKFIRVDLTAFDTLARIQYL